MDDKTDKEKLHIELFATNAYSNKIYAKWRNLCQNYNPTKKKKNCSKVLQREENDIEIPKIGYHLHEIYMSTRAFTY